MDFLKAQPYSDTNAPPAPDPDLALLDSVLRKDRKATAEFVTRFADPLYRYIGSRLRPRYDHVEDLVQEVFLAAWERLGQYRGNGPLQAWLMGIARHKIEDYYRDHLHIVSSLEDADPALPELATFPDFHGMLEQAELKRKTWDVLAGLPEAYRLALIWRYWERASARDMANKSGKTEKAIERLLARARAEFRERWDHE